jgi:hypothetical protein
MLEVWNKSAADTTSEQYNNVSFHDGVVPQFLVTMQYEMYGTTIETTY